jgi:hypothetical protein
MGWAIDTANRIAAQKAPGPNILLSGFDYGWGATPNYLPVSVPPPVTSVATGVNPTEINNALYGKIIPISSLGLARIGTAGLIFGPYFNAGKASFAVSFGFPSNPSGTRKIYEVALDGRVVWRLAAGSSMGALDASGFVSESFTCRFYSGTLTQAADPLEEAKFPGAAVAYRPQMTLWFDSLNLAPFGGKVPFVAAKIGDTTGGAIPADGIGLGEALERVAYSPWLEYTSDTFETVDLTELVGGVILTENISFLDLLRNVTRVYRTADIVQTDKLRLVDRGSNVTPDFVVGRDDVASDQSVQYTRQQPSSVNREIDLNAIDPDADYVFVPSKAQRPRYPVPVTASRGKDTITLPIIVDANTRTALVTFLKYYEEIARKRISFTGMPSLYEIEPGDLIEVRDLVGGFEPETFKVVETEHGANFQVTITAEAMLNCEIATDAYFGEVVLLLHFNGDDGSTSFEDSSSYAHAITADGGGQVDTGWAKFGTGSLLCDGSGDGAMTAYTGPPEFDLSPTNTSPYTIELWARPADVGDTNQVLICRDVGASGAIFNLYIPNATDELTFWTSSDASTATATLTTSGADLVNGSEYHIAVDKDSTGKVRIYVNGVMRASDTPADSVMVNSSVPFMVGKSLLSGSYNGHIDDVRVTKGVSRYGDIYGDGTFPVPNVQFPDS